MSSDSPSCRLNLADRDDLDDGQEIVWRQVDGHDRRCELGVEPAGEDRADDRPRRVAARAPDSPGRRPIAIFLAATGGGVQRNRIRLANALVERGLAVDVILPEARGPHLAQLAPSARLIDLRTRSPLPVVWRLARYLRDARPQALLASQQHTILAAIWARRLSQAALPLTVTQHNTLSEICRQSPYPLVRYLLPTLARWFFRHADTVTAVSQGVADDLSMVTGIDVKDITVVYNPIVTPDIGIQTSEVTGDPWLDHKDRPVVMAAGNLIAIKDFGTLLRAFARLRAQRPARLVILGEGPEHAKLAREARELGIATDVRFAGFKSNPFAFMARADVFVLSSRVEGFPTVLVEAMACGCPVVSTDCPSGPAELIDDPRLGRLVPMGDDTALAAAVLETLASTPDRKLLARRAGLYSADRIVSQYINLLGLEPIDHLKW
jgi:glycosyltransferase involved in cell wall biosynthesis